MKPGKNDPCPCGSGKKYKYCCERKAAVQPATAMPTLAELNRLVALFNAGQLAEVEQRARFITEQLPSFAPAWKLLGACLHRQDKKQEALPVLLKATQLLTKDAEAYYNLGVTQESLTQFGEAAASYRRALTLKPDFAEAYNNLGNTLKNLGQLNDAAASCRRAIALKPGYVGAHQNLGNILGKLGQLDEAVVSYRNALQLNPNYADAHSYLAETLKDLGQIEQALISIRRAVEINPNDAERHSDLLFFLSYSANHHHPSAHLAEALHYGERVAKRVVHRFSAWRCEPKPQRLRVGIVSGDLKNHPVGYFTESLLAQLDPTRLELIAYPTRAKEDDLTVRIKPRFTQWHPLVDLNDQAAAQLIHEDGVHILMDLSGHTSKNRLPLFAWRPAPVQCTWLGLPTTTGVAEMDYVLGDPIATPPEDAGHFSEQIWRLPETYVCLSIPDETLEVNTLPALANHFVTFASFNNLAKMNDATVAVWARILQSVPTSRLLLKAHQLKDATAVARTARRFAAQGIGSERLILEGQTVQRSDHLATYNRVDIALDPFPYPGVTTSAEALWMGVPVLTMQGDRFMSRTAASIAHNAGLPDWIASSEDDYVAKAACFAGDFPRLAALRAGLREQIRVSPLFDATRFARHFEDALWGMWQAKQQSSSITSQRAHS